MLHGVVGEAVAAEARIVGVEHDVIAAFGREQTVVGEGLRGAEVEDEDEIATHVGQDLIAVVVPHLLQGQGLEAADAVDQLEHGSVEVTEEVVLQVGIVDEAPLPTRILIRPAVAFAGEVDPLRVAELVAHEVQVAAVDGGGGDEADHLVQGQTALHHEVSVRRLHVPIHVGIDEPKDDRLIAHECLIVALGVADGLLVGAAVGRFPPDGRGVPVFVLLLLECLDPEVGDVHGHAVIEAVAAVLEACGEAGHAADLLGDGDGVRVDLMDELVGEREVDDGVAVLMSVVIVAVVAEGFAEAVAVVEHGGDAVEAEAVEAVLVEPELAVGEQEVEHFVAAVVEAERVPGAVFAPLAGVEVLVI